MTNLDLQVLFRFKGLMTEDLRDVLTDRDYPGLPTFSVDDRRSLILEVDFGNLEIGSPLVHIALA